MSVYIDRKYLTEMSFRLENFKQKKADLYNFKCFYCGDSKKNKLKARGYIYRKGNEYFYRCHNCGKGTTFANFLKDIDTESYKKYVFERYSNGDNKHTPYKKPTFDELKGNAFAKFAESKKELSLVSIDELPSGHYAREYIINRKVPSEFFQEIYYVPNFKEFIDTDFPDYAKEEIPSDERIVLLYRNENGDVTNVSGRALGESKIRYVTVKVSDEKKIFGLQRLQKKNRVYVVEGQFDSYFLDNCVASGDSNLIGVADFLEDCDCVLVFDNEPRNKSIVKQIEKAISKNYKVVIYPNYVENYKDINDMVVLGGFNVKELVANNIYYGPAASLKFISWRKC